MQTFNHDRLKEAMANANIDYIVLAGLVSRTPRAVSNWIAGRNEPPKHIIAHLETVLRVVSGYFYA